MENEQSKVYWYKCEKCKRRNPIPDSLFLESLDKQEGGLLDYCIRCDEKVMFLRRNAGDPVSKEEVLNWFKNFKGSENNTLFKKITKLLILK